MSFLTIKNLSLSYPSHYPSPLIYNKVKNRLIMPEDHDHHYDNQHQTPAKALDNFSLNVSQGELVCLLGPNGSGKTTLLRTLCGFEQPSTGTIKLDQNTLFSSTYHMSPQKRPIGIVFQNLALFPHLTAEQNIAFGLAGLSKQQKKNKLIYIHQCCETLPLAKKFPYELSGGEKQRVAIARALATDPKILLLDEPFSSLDPPRKIALSYEIKKLLSTLNVTCLMVLHDTNQAIEIADKVALMFNGQLEQYDIPERVIRHPKTMRVASFLGDTNFISCTVTKAGYQTPFGVIDFENTYRPSPSLKSAHRKSYKIALKVDDFLLTKREIVGPHYHTKPITFQVISDTLMGLYRIIKAQIPTGETITFRIARDDSDGLDNLDSLQLYLKNSKFCIY
ncbi:MAG: ABC transporter ATP-binding protein [Proteobacteria bacterium]|nr:ABC transporter ATP-binding protein [Pseudomonadota bacterium]